MTTIYDMGPVPEPTEDEVEVLAHVLPYFERALVRRLGRDRTDVLLDWWHVDHVATALTNGWEQARRRRIMSDLNEEIRLQQEQDDLLSYWPPWVLVPTFEP